MKRFDSLSIKQRQMVAILVVVLALFALSAFVVGVVASRMALLGAERQMHLLIHRLELAANLAESSTTPGFTAADYTALKPFFSQSVGLTQDFPMLVDRTGAILIHPYREGQQYPRDLIRRMTTDAQGLGVLTIADYRAGGRRALKLYFMPVEVYNALLVVELNPREVMGGHWRILLVGAICVGTALLLLLALGIATNPMIGSLRAISHTLARLAQGEVVGQVKARGGQEVAQLAQSLNQHILGMGATGQFAQAIARNELQAEHRPLGPHDLLGNTLISLRDSLAKAAQEEARRQEEDQRRSWFNLGLARFSDLLRQHNTHLTRLADTVLQHLVNYLNASQGGLFILNEDNPKDVYLELVSAFAYNRHKAMKKIVLPGEGLVGASLLERQTLHLTEIPDDYIEIGSGLGDATPHALLIVPLRMEDQILGIIEIASFHVFEPHQIEFVEKVGESIAASLSSVRISIRTKQLLEQSQQQREEMTAQEEEMRQNMEEMQATQEEMARRNTELEGLTAALNQALIFCELSPEGDFASANHNLVERLGLSPSAVLAMGLFEVLAPEDLQRMRALWPGVRQGEGYHGDLTLRGPNGQPLHLQCSISPVSDGSGGIRRILLIGHDVTATRLAEQRAAQRADQLERQLQALRPKEAAPRPQAQHLESLVDALEQVCTLCTIDSAGVILSINSRYALYLGGTPGELVGQRLDALHPMAIASPEGFGALWAKLMAGESQMVETLYTLDDRQAWFSEYLTATPGEEEGVGRAVLVGIDITLNKQYEAQIAELQARIQGPVGGA